MGKKKEQQREESLGAVMVLYHPKNTHAIKSSS